MKVLVFDPYAVVTPPIETDLEIIEHHLSQGDDVVFLGCNADLMTCDMNPDHYLVRCMQCIGKRAAGMARLSSKIEVRSFLNLTVANKDELRRLKINFSDIDELTSYQIEDFDIGWAVLSSLISMTRNPTPNREEMAQLVGPLVVSSFAVYRSIQNHLDHAKVDRVYIFNGRFAPTRAAVRACESRNVKFFTQERGHDLNHYELYENATCQDLGYIEQDIRRMWATANPQDRTNIGSEFFIERRSGVMQNWHVFITEQKTGLLPHDWNPGKRNIAIFSSSEDEFAGLGQEWAGPIYRDQLDGLQKILGSLDGNRNLHIYFRVHPNLAKVKNEYTEGLLKLKSDVLTVIPPRDPISTYALMDACNKVLTFGSTVGIESVYSGIPSILVGRCFFQNLGGTYNPTSHEEVIKLLEADLPPKDIEPALMYGYYMRTYGIPFKYFRGTAPLAGEFKGKEIQLAQWLSTLLIGIKAYWRVEIFANDLLRLYTSSKLGVKMLPAIERRGS